ncbi:hypothetical protein [Streptomyces sp. Je 1-79]|uniref:hypothetical protein n=1 Tax=Streptomyces sp. Je 1-79 TaxID=2943847 RepID=UPI0035AB8C1C
MADLREAVSAMRQGRLVALPTDTVRGLRADAFDPRDRATARQMLGDFVFACPHGDEGGLLADRRPERLGPGLRPC